MRDERGSDDEEHGRGKTRGKEFGDEGDRRAVGIAAGAFGDDRGADGGEVAAGGGEMGLLEKGGGGAEGEEGAFGLFGKGGPCDEEVGDRFNGAEASNGERRPDEAGGGKGNSGRGDGDEQMEKAR